MFKIDKNALICDLAETYHIYDYKQLPLLSVAVFACGLKSDSRIMMKISNQKLETTTLLLSSIVDNLNLIVWSKTKDGQNNRNRPKSLLREIYKEDKNVKAFRSGREFNNEREKIIENIKKGGE